MSEGPGTTGAAEGSPDPTAAAASVSASNSDANSAAPAKPDITCNRCGIVTTWTPYCPGCNAYLEFAGTPPWTPDEVTSTLPGESVVSASVPAAEDAAGTTDTGAVIAAAAAGAAIAGTAAKAPDELTFADQVRNDIHSAEADVTEAYDHLFHKDTEAGAAADTTGMRPLKARRARKAAEAAAAAAAAENAEGVVFENPHVVQAPPISEPSAALPSEKFVAEQRTRAVDVEDENADGQVCPRCHLRNPAGRTYCEWCGTALPDTVLAPESDAYNPFAAGHDGKTKAKPYRSPWLRNLLILLGLALAGYVIYWIFWGPGAQTSYLFFKVSMQKVTEFFDPTSGKAAPVSSITASSTLQSTSTDNLSAVQSRNFWASAPMTLFGAGTTLTFNLSEDSQVDRMLIYPGIQNNQLDVDALATPREITLELTPGNFFTTTLEQVDSSSNWEQVVSFPVVNTKKIIMRINSVYPPRYPDPNGGNVGSVAISSVQFLQVPSKYTVTLPTSVPTAPPSTVPTSIPTP